MFRREVQSVTGGHPMFEIVDGMESEGDVVYTVCPVHTAGIGAMFTVQDV